MPADYAIDVEQRLVLTTFTGAVTLDDVMGLIARLRSDSRFEPTFSELVDLSGASAVHLGHAEFQRLGSLDPFSRDSKRAFLVPSQGAVFGVTRMFHILRNENPSIRIVHTIDEAKEWLSSTE